MIFSAVDRDRDPLASRLRSEISRDDDLEIEECGCRLPESGGHFQAQMYHLDVPKVVKKSQ
jgi:hypothetical protein